MGQGQSTNSAQQEEAPAKADYYELLGVERTATEDEIKKAYRRKALELHPDRNYGNVEWATTLFAEIQSAYEVLSDPQERAWYDSHKDILLRGDQATGQNGDEFSYNIRMTSAEDVMKLMMKFNGRLEYNNSPSGFFGGLHDFFSQIAKEEDIACQWENMEPLDYPEFGHDDDDYEDVVRPFYAAWNGFATRKSYSWKDQYRLSDAPDRRIRRLMEKENKKLREDGIQEYNEAVRSLVAFIRKRDPRVQNNQKSEAERQKALREATAAQAARSRAARQARLEELDKATVPEWAKSRPKDEHEGGFSSESEIEEHEYDCVVCDKTFKSEAQFTAHEKSKKHVKLLKQLQKEMRAEGKKLDIPTTGSPREDPDGHEEPEPEPQSDHDSQRTHFPTNKDDSEASEPSDIVDQPSTASGLDGTTAETAETSEASDNENDDYTSRAKVEERLIGEPSMEGISTRVEDINLEGTGTGTGTGTPATSDPETSTQQQKLGKAKQKRAKKAAQAQQQAEKVVSDIQCAVCKAEFPTKNKLFDHLKANKTHAAPPAQIKGAKASKSKRK